MDHGVIVTGSGFVIIGWGFGKDFTPWRDDHRMTISAPPIGMGAALRRRDDEAARFNGAGPQQHMPMRLTAGKGKGCRYRDHVGAGPRKRAVEMRKTNIIANCQANSDTAAFGEDQPVAGGKMIRLAIASSITNIGIKHVNLVIGGTDAAVAGDQHSPVHNPRIQPAANEKGPDQKIDRMRGGTVRQRRQRVAVILPLGLALQCVARGGKKGGSLGKADQFGPGPGRAANHRDQLRQRFPGRAGSTILQRRDADPIRGAAIHMTGHAASNASSLPAPSRSYSSWHPPTCTPSIKICGTEVRPPERSRISARRFAFIETSICL